MNVQTNIPLSTLTTMKLGGNANYVADVTTKDELQSIYNNSKKINQPVYVIGGGSNLIAHDEGFPGLIVHNKIMGITLINDTPESTTVTAGGGESWDGLVKYAVDLGLQGIEAMSGIPGTVGAAPVQNIGAYGQELSTTFVSLEAYDTTRDGFVTLSWEDCNFSYRNSIFRSTEAGRYIITSVTLTLYKRAPESPYYDALEKYFAENNIDSATATIQMIRDAVIKIRAYKLPDPTKTPNTGSFFKNAIVENWKAEDLARTYDTLKLYPADEEHMKIPAGWLIETCELKNELLHGMRVHEGNAVVLVNESATSYSDLAAAREEIISAVRDKFQIVLEQEPLELVLPVTNQ
jgi:UDP-N-acetylmuramate dehydrogenase